MVGARTGRGWFSPANEWRITLRDGAALLTLALAIRWVGCRAPSRSGTTNSSRRFGRDCRPPSCSGLASPFETNPPYYYLLMHFWIRAFGSGEFSLRFPPMLFSASTVVVVYAIGATLIDRPTARIGGVFLACCNPVSVYFAQEARSYALVALLDGVVIIALAKYEARRRRERTWFAGRGSGFRRSSRSRASAPRMTSTSVFHRGGVHRDRGAPGDDAAPWIPGKWRPGRRRARRSRSRFSRRRRRRRQWRIQRASPG